MKHYWIAVASREHVLRGTASGIVQVCHGKGGPLKKMVPGDWIIYYSPTEVFGEKAPCRRFTALGKIIDGEPYQFRMSENFVPWRRDVTFSPIIEVPIEPLIPSLSFIKNKAQWGFPFRRGCFTIPEEDFVYIAAKMGVILHDGAS